jgi:hypothetical protein
MRKLATFLAVTIALLTGSAPAVEISNLYGGQAIVTGIFEPERTRGLRQVLLDVLVKVSAEPRLIDDPRVQPLLDRAKDFMLTYEYEDRMKGTPVRDEQGTRDRPYDLRIKFDSAKIDAALADLGLKPWSSDRPVLVALVTVEYPASTYMLTSDGYQGLGQKQALVAAATRRGIPVILSENGVAAPKVVGDQPLLQGILRWQADGAFWRTEWTLTDVRFDVAQPPSLVTRKRSWSIDSSSFDEAFRNGVGEAAATLAGRR